jgi:hypothetical protein
MVPVEQPVPVPANEPLYFSAFFAFYLHQLLRRAAQRHFVKSNLSLSHLGRMQSFYHNDLRASRNKAVTLVAVRKKPIRAPGNLPPIMFF